METSIKRLLGIMDQGKFVYRFENGDVTKEEFEYGQMLDSLVFGDKGYVETLGPVWDMVNDPRFSAIEDAFVINRHAVVGGDASLGKQYISSDGSFTSSIGEIEQYSELLGEGRYFLYTIKHPNKLCSERRWLLRIFPEVLDKDDLIIPEANPNLICECNWDDMVDPYMVKDWDAGDLWSLIKQECPNYFTKEGNPNAIAKRLFDLFRADLLGLIFDYAYTPLSEVYINLDTGEIFGENETRENPKVFLEVDLLEKALTQRAVLRAGAAKILRQIEFSKTIKEELGEDFVLTPYEKDQLLRLVYNPPKIGSLQINPENNWYGFLKLIKGQVLQFLKAIKATGESSSERADVQLTKAKINALDTFDGLQSGYIQPINQYTEPEVDIELDSHAMILQSILNDPMKMELFLMWVEAERLSEGNPAMSKLYSVLTPIFTNADFEVTEESYHEYLNMAQELSFYDKPNVEEFQEVYG